MGFLKLVWSDCESFLRDVILGVCMVGSRRPERGSGLTDLVRQLIIVVAGRNWGARGLVARLLGVFAVEFGCVLVWTSQKTKGNRD